MYGFVLLCLGAVLAGARTHIALLAGARTGIALQAGARTGIALQAGARTGIAWQAGARTDIASQAGARTDIASQAGARTDIASQAGARTDIALQADARTDIASQAGARTDIASQTGARTDIALPSAPGKPGGGGDPPAPAPAPIPAPMPNPAPAVAPTAPPAPAITTPPVKPDSVCYEALGCFSTEYPWWSVLRPLAAPESPEKVGTQFYLFTRKRPQRTLVQTKPNINLDGLDYDGKRLTVFITHGFTGDSNTTWMINMKDALLEKFDANLFLTDWGPGAAGSLRYLQVASNTRVVGAEMARLIEHLIKKYEVDPQNIHLIGHSLGAQISSYAGKRVKNIGKLTALDPAQPAFEGFDRSVRLDASDASFVEVVHTDAKPTIPTLGLGMMGAFGDVDYYINGGFKQPGCLIPKNIPPLTSIMDFLKLPVQVISNLVACPHGRSTLVYIEAIRQSNCTFWGHPGNFVEKVVGVVSRGYLHRYLTPSDEDCTVKSCSPLQLDNKQYPARGSFVVATTSNKPFCISEPEVDSRMQREVESFLKGLSRGTINVLGGISKNIPLPSLSLVSSLRW